MITPTRFARPLAALTAWALLTAVSPAKDIAGSWKGEFDSPRGRQTYLFDFKIAEGALTATATAKAASGGEPRKVEFIDAKWEGEAVTFAEVRRIQGNEIRIDYTGQIADAVIRFTRKVGDFGSQDFEARRVEATADQPERPAGSPPREPRGFGGPITLRDIDKPAFPEPPAGWDAKRDDIARGKLEMVEYDSKTVGSRRKMNVYTPPGYSTDRKYPVLYLLHGIGGDETEWQRFAQPDVMLDNLIADGKAEPMIVVMPNGRAQKNDRAEGNVMQHAPAFAVFERDLLDDVIPAIEARYSTFQDRDNRALAGLSMGGGQSLNFGLGHLDTFGWVGGFSSAPNTKPASELLPDPEAAKKLHLLWLSCGNRDGLIRISQNFQSFLKEKDIPHVWHVTSHAHDPPEWKQALYYFIQKLKFPASKPLPNEAGASR